MISWAKNHELMLFNEALNVQDSIHDSSCCMQFTRHHWQCIGLRFFVWELNTSSIVFPLTVNCVAKKY